MYTGYKTGEKMTDVLIALAIVSLAIVSLTLVEFWRGE